MYKWKKTIREDKTRQERKNPSFSSSLLDEIYRSTDDGAAKSPDLKFYRETMSDKQSKSSARTNRAIGDEQMSSLRRACLVEKWMDKKVNEKANVNERQFLNGYERKLHLDHDHDQDALFFSSTSSSSDSSSGGFSSSDTDSLYGSRSKPSCFIPSRPKPVRTSITAQPEKVKKTERALFYEQRELHMFDDYRCHFNSETGHAPKLDEETDLIKSKSKALNIYSNLKKVKHPISPGGRLANFINSLFTTGNAKKTKSSNLMNTSRSSKPGHVPTCSSAASFSRSCLSKNSPSTKRNEDKRSVRFYPVSVIVDEDCRPCGHKCLYEKEEAASLMSVSVAATAWKIGKSPSRKNKDERVGEIAREFLKDYNQNQKKHDLIMRDVRVNYDHNNDEEDDDDAASCASSDLFELDHLNVIGNNVNRYCEELPVYETTHVDTNRTIAKGLMIM